MSEQELKELASQFRKPNGNYGLQIGQAMNETNMSMTRKTLEHLSLMDNDQVLEIGHGNANHLLELLDQAQNLHYFGLEISELMSQESEKFSIENQLTNTSTFQLYDGTYIPFKDNLFDKLFTVNTLYFWQEPTNLLNELNRVLKPNGTLCITFVDEETLNQRAYTDFGFTKYNHDTFRKLVAKSTLKLMSLKQYSEIVRPKMPDEVERKYWVATLTKGTNTRPIE